MMIGLATPGKYEPGVAPLVRRNKVEFAPAPRSVTPLLTYTMSLLIVKVPADSSTTWPSGQASMAAWMPAVASWAPSPYVEAFTFAQTVVRAGIPPGTPGFHAVRRSADSAVKPLTFTVAAAFLEGSATLVATT